MADAGARIELHVLLISAVVMLAAAISMLDTTIVNDALATLGRQLPSPIRHIQRWATGHM